MEHVSYAAYLATFLPLLVALINPAVASFLSRSHWPELVTQGLTVVLSAIEGFAAQLFEGGDFSISWATATALGTYVISAVARSQFWENTKTDARLLAFPDRLGSSAGDLSSVDASSLVLPVAENAVVDAASLVRPEQPRPSPTPHPRHAANTP